MASAGFPVKKYRAFITVALIAVNCAVFVACCLAGGPGDTGVLVDHGAKVDALIWEGQYWRLFASMFLHIGLLHLLLNVYCLLIFGSLLEEAVGHSALLLIYLTSGLIGNSASLAFSSSISVGASGAILGVVGALAAFAVFHRKSIPRERFILYTAALIPFLASLAYFGSMESGVDQDAHWGGFLWGALAGLTVEYSRKGPKALPMAVATALLLSSAGALFLSAGLAPQRDRAVKTYLVLAGLDEEREDYGDARLSLEKAAALDPGNMEVLHRLGKVLISSGDLLKGIVTWEQAAKKDRTIRRSLSKVYLIIAESSLNAGKTGDALLYYRKTLEFNPREAKAWQGMSSYYFLMGDLSMGLALLKKAIALTPGDRALGALFKESLKELFRVECYQANVFYTPDVRPREKSARLNREGEKELARTGDYEKALALFHRALALDGTYALPYENIGMIYLVIGKYDQAREYLEKSISCAPGNPGPYTGLGDLERLQGSPEKAAQLYRRSIACNSRFAPAYARLAELFLTGKNHGKAEEYLAMALALDRGNAHFHLLASSLALGQGQDARHFREMNTALALARAAGNADLEAYILKRLRARGTR
ncbi:MAG: rhomboid family intramembrane serine protease [Candidatus Eremiobacteraeota bacterium]|nr:rhomboid family intramembrane serine protease [Candidatus Eremiobacteraeota bacterium]